MNEACRKSGSRTVTLLLIFLGLLVMPVAMIGCAVLEYSIFGTNYLEQVSDATGTRDWFVELYRALRPVFGW
jgi:hypothetical protein